MALGADGVELDVRLSADGQVVVIHDADLSRITHGRDRRPVAELTAQELTRIELENGATIPTLEEVLRWAGSVGAVLNIELKTDHVTLRQLARQVKQVCDASYPKHGPMLVLSSFHLGILLYLKALGTTHALAYLFDSAHPFLRFIPFVKGLGIKGFHPEHTLLCEHRVACWNGCCAFIGTWTVNSDDEIRHATDLGVDVLITDDPERARTLVSSRT
jgi:glycerophosphoryl diester phosphodiesterase